LIEAITGGGFAEKIHPFPACLTVGNLDDAALYNVMGLIPKGTKWDELITINPPKTARSWSQFILIFWKDPGAVADTRRARGKPPGGKGDDKIGE
jgi:hypothetical protein